MDDTFGQTQQCLYKNSTKKSYTYYPLLITPQLSTLTLNFFFLYYYTSFVV